MNPKLETGTFPYEPIYQLARMLSRHGKDSVEGVRMLP
jgi:hypothetical protein